MINKRRIFEIIQIGEKHDLASRVFDFFIVGMIVINIVIAVMATFPEFDHYGYFFYILELFTVIIFTIEYILRVWTADYLYPQKSKRKAMIKYIFSLAGIIDFLSFFPFYLPVFFPGGAVVFRMFRVVRILQLFRVTRYFDAFHVIRAVLLKKKTQLLSSVFIIVVLMVAASICMYSLEHTAQPEVFKNAFSGFWWAAASLLTIGYGDIVPITIGGQIFGTVISFLGVGMVAIPTGILSAGFVEQMSAIKGEDNKKYCPYCGKKL